MVILKMFKLHAFCTDPIERNKSLEELGLTATIPDPAFVIEPISKRLAFPVNNSFSHVPSPS